MTKRISISKSYSFDSAHRLDLPTCTVDENNRMFGKCNRLHGHTYKLTVEVTGPVDRTTGMVLNYYTLDELVKPVVDDILDHQFLNDVFPNMLTTAENMVDRIALWLCEVFPHNVHLSALTLQETPKTVARWEP